MATFISHSPEETAALGEQWGRDAAPGWIIGLSGDLGAGKTQLVKGLARGLGITARIQSPTFALVNEYSDGRLRLAHLDLYRLDTPEQIHAAGLHEYFRSPPGVVVVEWCERWPEFILQSTTSPRTEPAPLPSSGHPLPRSERGRGTGRGGASDLPRTPGFGASHLRPSRLRLVHIEQINNTGRRITYEDSGG